MHKSKFHPQLLALIAGFALILFVVAGPILHEGQSQLVKIILIVATGLAVLFGFFVNSRQRISDRAEGRSPDDEFTELARLSAGHAAFKMSLVLWLAIFVAQGFFDSTRTMLGLGILGQCGFYGICLAFFNRSGSLHGD